MILVQCLIEHGQIVLKWNVARYRVTGTDCKTSALSALIDDTAHVLPEMFRDYTW